MANFPLLVAFLQKMLVLVHNSALCVGEYVDMWKGELHPPLQVYSIVGEQILREHKKSAETFEAFVSLLLLR